ncbi:MAG TPA: ABC transporter permease [Candidatus Limnocylindrales bacterium]
MGEPAPPWQATSAMVANELRLLARRSENVLAAVIVPAVVLVFFALVPGTPGSAVTGRVDALLPGTLALAVIAASFVNLGIATAYERSYGVLKRLGSAPIHRGTVVAAKVVAVIAVTLLTSAVLIALGVLALGWRPGPAGAGPVLVLATLALGTAAFAGLGLALAGAVRAEGVLAIANGLFVAFVLFGGIVVPAGDLPGPLADIARALPSSALADSFRAALGDGGVDAGRSLTVVGGWAVAAIVLATRTFRWD